jgi:heme exporter protein D
MFSSARAKRTDKAFFILNGRVVVQREEGGRFRITRSVGPGEQFGEVSALGHSARAATAIAEEPVTVLRITEAALHKLMKFPSMSRIIHSRMHERLMITDRALMTLRSIVQVSMLINVFLLINEVFKEFYSGNLHVASSKYLFLGLHGHHALVPWIWTAVVLNLIAMVLLVCRSVEFEVVKRDLCAGDCRYLDREGHGPRDSRIHSHSARRDR